MPFYDSRKPLVRSLEPGAKQKRPRPEFSGRGRRSSSIPFYDSIDSTSATKRLASSLKNADTTLNTASLKPPMFRTAPPLRSKGLRLAARVECSVEEAGRRSCGVKDKASLTPTVLAREPVTLKDVPPAERHCIGRQTVVLCKCDDFRNPQPVLRPEPIIY